MILLADIVSFYPNECQGIVEPQFILDRLDILTRYNNDGHLSSDIRYIKQQFRLRQ
jgi:hypothetical protein